MSRHGWRMVVNGMVSKFAKRTSSKPTTRTFQGYNLKEMTISSFVPVIFEGNLEDS